MNARRALSGLIGILAMCSIAVSAQQKPAASPSDAELTKSAMTGAPASIAKGASIIAMSADGKMRTIRKGTNNFWCMADNPGTPGPDPMCGDQNAMAWVEAWVAKKTPPANRVGMMYMLAGGTDASNTDPYAQKPTAGNAWINTGPHVMVVGGQGMLEGYPRAATPDTSQPYVMWAGTPYEHLMFPIR